MTAANGTEVLLVSDARDADVVSDRLEDTDDRLSVRTVGEIDAATAALDAGSVDCVVVDGRAADGRDPAPIRRVVAAVTSVPVVLYGGSAPLVDAALDAGVTDVIRPGEESVPPRARRTPRRSRLRAPPERRRSSSRSS